MIQFEQVLTPRITGFTVVQIKKASVVNQPMLTLSTYYV